MQIKRGGGGFTLAELLIVMAIIVVLAAVAIPTFGRQLETSRETADMQAIRSAYEDALTYAILDAADGEIDGKNGGTDWTAATAATTAGITYADSKYTVTFASTDPVITVTQTGTGWQYVNSKLQGEVVPSIYTAKNGDTAAKKATAVIFEFELGSTGNVKLKSGGITVSGMT